MITGISREIAEIGETASNMQRTSYSEKERNSMISRFVHDLAPVL